MPDSTTLEPTVEAPVEEIAEEIAEEVSVKDLRELLTQEYMEVELKINWFSTSAQIAEALVQRMVDPVKANRNAVRLSKSLFDAKHPAVKKVAACKRAIYGLLDAYTHCAPELPVTRSTVDVSEVKSEAESSKVKANDLMKKAGCRLIPKSIIDEFHPQLQVLIENLYAAARDMDTQLVSIKAKDKKELAELYDERDYPESVAELINVRGPSYRQVGLGADFGATCPKTMSIIAGQVTTEYVSCFKLATGDFAKTLQELAVTVANQLSNRVRLQPLQNHTLREVLWDAEIVQTLEHKDAPEEVPEGSIMFLARYKPKGKARNDDIWHGPMPKDQYLKELRPYETVQNKKVYDSSVEALMSHLEHFRKVGDLLTIGGESKIAEAVQTLQDTIRTGGDKTPDIIKEMRNSRSYRGSVSSALNKIAEFMQPSIDANLPPMKRRLITKKKKTEED